MCFVLGCTCLVFHCVRSVCKQAAVVARARVARGGLPAVRKAPHAYPVAHISSLGAQGISRSAHGAPVGASVGAPMEATWGRITSMIFVRPLRCTFALRKVAPPGGRGAGFGLARRKDSGNRPRQEGTAHVNPAPQGVMGRGSMPHAGRMERRVRWMWPGQTQQFRKIGPDQREPLM